MAELKTKQSSASVQAFLKKIEDPQRRADCIAIMELMRAVTRAEPKMWGTSVVGFGNQHLKYESGRELDWFLVGFSPRKQNLTLYLMPGFDRHTALLKQLGKHSIGKGCLYIKRLSDVDVNVLKQLVRESVTAMSRKS
jgi:hypothetical protein